MDVCIKPLQKENRNKLTKIQTCKGLLRRDSIFAAAWLRVVKRSNELPLVVLIALVSHNNLHKLLGLLVARSNNLTAYMHHFLILFVKGAVRAD